MDYHKREIVRIDKLATGGKGDSLTASDADFREDVIGHCTTAEYVPELLPKGTRKDLKELNVLQPNGPSFKVSQDESLVEWQKWRFRVGFNPREGATIHDVWYDGRSVLYRLSMSEMVSKDHWSDRVQLTDGITRLCHMRIPGIRSIESRPLILGMEVLEIVQIICHLDAIV
jgi:hypothetical protein